MKLAMSRRLDVIEARRLGLDKPWRRVIVYPGESAPYMDPTFNWILRRVVNPTEARHAD